MARTTSSSYSSWITGTIKQRNKASNAQHQDHIRKRKAANRADKRKTIAKHKADAKRRSKKTYCSFKKNQSKAVCRIQKALVWGTIISLVATPIIGIPVGFWIYKRSGK